MSFLFFVLLGVNALAQKEEVSKDLLMSTLNSVAHVKLDADQEKKLIDYNKGFVDEVYSILDGDQEDKGKKKALKELNSVREKDLRGIIGKHKTNKQRVQITTKSVDISAETCGESCSRFAGFCFVFLLRCAAWASHEHRSCLPLADRAASEAS